MKMLLKLKFNISAWQRPYSPHLYIKQRKELITETFFTASLINAWLSNEDNVLVDFKILQNFIVSTTSDSDKNSTEKIKCSQVEK
jgi:hypothetical protein